MEMWYDQRKELQPYHDTRPKHQQGNEMYLLQPQDNTRYIIAVLFCINKT